jgi:uncharacterized protein (TIGR00299 family) protein
MRVAFFDAVGGAAGDMILGALLDAGLPLDDLERELKKLSLSGYRLSHHKVQKQHIAATQFLVELEADDHHHHDHHSGDDHEAHGRSLAAIERLIGASALSERVKQRALDIFRRLGAAEAKIHGVALAEVHFHEVGAIDSIVDIVGAAIALDLLGIERVYCSPLPLGSGTVQTQHGAYPIPAPATLELLAAAGAPTATSNVVMEQVTPTGAAVLTTVGTFERPAMTIDRVGYGSGEADLAIPNVLRVWLGEVQESGAERLVMLETNIDDMNPELYGHVLERLMIEGALDALLVPVIMKKSRPGVKVEVLCRQADHPRLLDVLMSETSTLGVRLREVSRVAAEREVVQVQTRYGPVSVKIKRWGGRALAAAPEFEETARLAERWNVPAIDVYNEAASAGRALLDPPG